MSDIVKSWKYSEDLRLEDVLKTTARKAELEFGLQPITPALGAQIALLAKLQGTSTAVEIGTGAGLSALWLLQAGPLQLTTIDHEPGHHEAARDIFHRAGHPSVRCITGNPSAILPRINDDSYDFVLMNGLYPEPLESFEHALRVARPGGLIVVTHVLLGGTVANPANREPHTEALRTLIQSLQESPSTSWSLSPAGSGLLQVIKS